MMPPDLVYRTRERLGLSALVLARVIGVDEATLEGWEMARKPVATQHATEQLMRAIAQAAQAARDPHKLGHAMTEAAMQQGPMAALYLALHAIYWRTAPRNDR